jgi:ribosomal protein S18 acetylase RimI-like enzyme
MVDDWWGGRPVRGLAQRFLFDHFADTSLVAERDGAIAGFLIGFLSSSCPGEAYVHLVGVATEWRGSGLGHELYERFFGIVRARECEVVRAITAPVNRESIAFHRRLGFELEPSDREVDGVPVHRGYAVNGDDRVLFVRRLG